MSHEERQAYMMGFKMAIDSSKTAVSRRIDPLAIVVNDGIESINTVMERANQISDSEIMKSIESRPKGLV